MITLPKKFLCALETVLYIACHTGVRPISSKEICTKNGLKPRYLEPIMQQLVHAGILRGVRGPKGGYFLARERRKISAVEIFELVVKIEMGSPKDMPASLLGNAVILPLWESFEAHIIERLQDITIEDLCKKAENKGIMDTIRMVDFVI